MLKNLKLDQLKALSVMCGLPCSGRKDILRVELERMYDRIKVNDSNEILSIDLGLKNLALCHVNIPVGLNNTVVVKRWQIHDLNLPSVYNPKEYSSVLAKWIQKEIVENGFGGDRIFIERQRYRSQGMPRILETILRLGIIEAQIHALINHLPGQGFESVPVNPLNVARYFGLPEGRAKKQAAIHLVRSFISDSSIDLPADIRLSPIKRFKFESGALECFKSSKKLDDLSDSFLQAIAIVEFNENCRKLFTDGPERLLDNKATINYPQWHQDLSLGQ